MKRESLFYKILSGIHIVFFTSILCFFTILLSGTFLLLPVLGAAFMIGKDIIYKVININDSIVKKYFVYLKRSFKLMKFIPVHIIMLLNVAGMILSAQEENLVYSVVCLAIIAFLLVFMLYTAGYFVFFSEKVDLIEVLLVMLLKLNYLLPVFAGMVFCVFFFSSTLLAILCFCGSFFVFAVEAVVFIQILYYKKILGVLDENDEFAYLVNRSKKHNV